MIKRRPLLPLLLIFALFATNVHARMGAPTDWRWRNDDGDLKSATWAADINNEATLVGHRELIRLRTHISKTFDPDELNIQAKDSETIHNYTDYFDYADSGYLTGEEPAEQLFSIPEDLERQWPFHEDGDCVVMKSANPTITLPAGTHREIEICLKALKNTPEGTYTFILPNMGHGADAEEMATMARLNYVHARHAHVTTLEVTEIKRATATGHGDIIDLGLRAPVRHGVCWSTAENPTVSDNTSDEGAASETGAFSTPITGLEENTTYYLRAYATNNAGTVYGEQVVFSTGDTKESYGPGGCFVKALLP